MFDLYSLRHDMNVDLPCHSSFIVKFHFSKIFTGIEHQSTEASSSFAHQFGRSKNANFEYKYFKNLINAYHLMLLKSSSFHFLKIKNKKSFSLRPFWEVS